MDKWHSPIFITGCPRSGTSMIADVLARCGVYSGNVPEPHRLSPRGLREHIGIFEHIVKPHLVKMEACPAGQFPLPDLENLSIPTGWQSKIDTILTKEGYDGALPWMYKSNKLALLWPIWDYTYPNAKWIIVRRRTGDIIQSCLQTTYMQAFKTSKNTQAIGATTEEEAWKWWVHWYEARFVEMIEAGLNVKIVWPERMVNGDYQQIYEAVEWAGLQWSSDAPAIIDPKFWKVRRRETNGDTDKSIRSKADNGKRIAHAN